MLVLLMLLAEINAVVFDVVAKILAVIVDAVGQNSAVVVDVDVVGRDLAVLVVVGLDPCCCC